jgi:hypothetical protein
VREFLKVIPRERLNQVFKVWLAELNAAENGEEVEPQENLLLNELERAWASN